MEFDNMLEYSVSISSKGMGIVCDLSQCRNV